MVKTMAHAKNSNTRVTAFLGAGATLEIGGPTTKELTDAITAEPQTLFSVGQLTSLLGAPVGQSNPLSEPTTPVPAEIGKIPLIRIIRDILRRHYGKEADSVNFEDIFHAVETLSSFRVGLQPDTFKLYRPAITAFARPDAPPALFDQMLLTQSANHIIETIGKHVSEGVAKFKPSDAHSWFADFWRKGLSRCPWDVASLTYDNCVEQSLSGKEVEDGFEDYKAGIQKFNPSRILNTKASRTMNLHGSLLYGFPKEVDSTVDHEDLFRFENYEKAKETWFWRSQNHAQAGDLAIAGPIITGQRKTDKLLGYPYSAYYSALQNAIVSNRGLLIVGYSFGDLHFNRLLGRLRALHGTNRRIVLITYFPKSRDKWREDPGVMDWPPHQMLRFIFQASGDKRPFSMTYNNPLQSKDGCLRIYFEGFKSAIEMHGDDILTFLTS